jgi:hypothetical protein
MESRVVIQCLECKRRREIVGEIPDEYTRCFEEAVHNEGWAPHPESAPALICASCLASKYAGHESVDDEEKVRGRKNPLEP